MCHVPPSVNEETLLQPCSQTGCSGAATKPWGAARAGCRPQASVVEGWGVMAWQTGSLRGWSNGRHWPWVGTGVNEREQELGSSCHRRHGVDANPLPTPMSLYWGRGYTGGTWPGSLSGIAQSPSAQITETWGVLPSPKEEAETGLRAQCTPLVPLNMHR